MSPQEIIEKINELIAFKEQLESDSSIPYEVDTAFRARLAGEFVNVSSLPSGLFDAPLGQITAPSGGSTVDSEARTAVNTIITRLETLGLVDPN